MSGKPLDTDLSVLVRRYGYARVRASLMRIKPASRKEGNGENGGERRSSGGNRGSGVRRVGGGVAKKRPSAVAMVRAIEVQDDDKRHILMDMAEKFERREFLPRVALVRYLLEGMGMESEHIKARTQSLRKLFEALAERPIERLRVINDSQVYGGRPSRLQDIVDGIAMAGHRDRQRAAAEAAQKSR